MINKFGELLFELRKEKGYTQAELADKLGLTNKAISKWETGEAFPETSMLVPLASIFNITVDELLRGQREYDREKTNKDTDYNKIIQPMNKKEAITVASSIALILFGVLILITLAVNNISYGIYLPILLGCVAVAVFMLIFTGFNRVLRSSDLDEETKSKGKKSFPLLPLGVAIVILSVIPLIVMVSLDISEAIYLPVFFAVLLIGVPLIILGGIMWDNFSKRYNLPTDEEPKTPGEKRIEDAFCGVIMLSATAIFLLLGFLKGLWHPAWVVFPIGGILCGIVSTVIKGFRKE